MKTFLLILCMMNFTSQKKTGRLRRRSKHKYKGRKHVLKKRYRSKKSKSRSKRSNSSSSSSSSSSCSKHDPPTPPSCTITGYSNPPTIQIFSNLTFSNSTTSIFKNKYLEFLETCYETCSTTGTKTRITCEDLFFSLNEKECGNDSECIRILNLNLNCLKTISNTEVCLNQEICVGLNTSVEFSKCLDDNNNGDLCLTIINLQAKFDVCSSPDLNVQCLDFINCNKNNLDDPIKFNISSRGLNYNVINPDSNTTMISVNNPPSPPNIAEFSYDSNLKFESENLMARSLGDGDLVKTSFGINSTDCIENGFSFLFYNETKLQISQERLLGICSNYI